MPNRTNERGQREGLPSICLRWGWEVVSEAGDAVDRFLYSST